MMKITRYRHARRLLLLLTMMVAGANGAWAQTTYTYIVGEDITQAPTAGMTVSSVPGISMEWGTTNNTDGYVRPTWSYVTSGSAPNSAFTNNYVLGGTTWPKTSEKADPDETNGVPFYGCFLKFAALQAGTLTFGLYDGSTTSAVALMTVDGSSNKTVANHLEGGSDNSYTGSFAYSLTTVSGYTYYLYLPQGTEIGFYGFAFTPTNTTYTAAYNWDFAGASSSNRGDYPMGTTYSSLMKESVDLFLGLTFKVAAADRKLHYTEHGITQAEGSWWVLVPSSTVPKGAIIEIVIESLDKNRTPDFSLTGGTVFATNPVFDNSNWKTYSLRFYSDGSGDITLNCGNNTYLHSIKISTLSYPDIVKHYTIGTSDLTSLPVLSNKGTGSTTIHSSNDAVIRDGYGRVKGPGVAYLKATSTDGSTASCKFIVTANEATATNTGSTFTFTGNGLYSNKVVDLDGLSMRFGNGSEALVVENKDEAGELAVKVMDDNGFFFRIAGQTPPTMGTVYRLRVETKGTFSATGYFTANTKLINSSGTNQSFSYSGTSLTASLSPGTYYLYNDSGNDADVLWLHSFGFTPSASITVGQSQFWFIPTLTSATFTVTDGASLLSIEHGVVKINQIFSAFDEFGYAYATVRATYADSSTEDFDIRVKKDSWDFSGLTTVVEKDLGTGWLSWSEVSATNGMQFKGNWDTSVSEKALHIIYNKSGYIKLPIVGGQTLKFKARRGSNSQDIAITNLSSPQPNNNGNIRNAGNTYGDKSAIAVAGVTFATLGTYANDANIFMKEFSTEFPLNPAASSSFLSSTYDMYLGSGYRRAQIVSGTDPAAKTVFYYSDNTSIAEVDPWTGFILTKTTGTVTIHARPLGVVGVYNGSDADITYTLNITNREVLTTTVSVSDLCYENEKNADAGLNRIIPNFELLLSGRDGLKTKTNGTYLNFRKTNDLGHLVIKPRLKSSSKEVLFTSVTLTTPTVTEGSVKVNGQTGTVTSGSTTTFTLTKDDAELSTSNFHEWTSVTEEATQTGTAVSAELNLNTTLAAGNLVCGFSTVPSLCYADITGYNKIVFTGTPGVELRLLLNRVSDSGAMTEILTEIDENHTAQVSLTGLSFAHLNAIKTSWDSPTGQISSIHLVGDGVPQLDIRYNGTDNNGFMLSQLEFSYQAEENATVADLLDNTKLKPGMGFEKSIIYANGPALDANTATYSTFKNFKAPSLTFTSADAEIATVSYVATGAGTMVTSDFEESTSFTGSFAGTTYFDADNASYTVKGTLTIAAGGTHTLTVAKGNEIELIAFADGGETTLTLDNTVGVLADNNKAPLDENLLLNGDGETATLNCLTTETAFYAYAKSGDKVVTLTNTGAKPVRLLNFRAYYRETENKVDYLRYSDYGHYDDFIDAAGPFVYAGGFTLPAPTLRVVDTKSGEVVTSLYQLSENSYESLDGAAVVNTATGVLSSNSDRALVTAITDATIKAGMSTVGDAWGYAPNITLSGTVRVYPYAMTWNFPSSSSTEGLQFTGNHAVELVGTEQRLDIIGNVISSIMIPVQKKQKVVITAHAFRNDNKKGGNQMINLRNAADIYEETASQTTYTGATVDYEYTAQADGYLTLKNITREYYASGRTLSIKKIVVKPQELLFADGFEVPISEAPRSGSYQNPVINAMDGEVTYSYSTDFSRLASGAKFDTETGVFTANGSGKIFDSVGDLVVNVSASKGDLVHESTGSYTLKVLTYSFEEAELQNSYNGSEWTVTNSENVLSSSYDPVPVPTTIYYEKVAGNPKVDIDFDGKTTNYSVKLDGLGTVRIIAETGSVSASFLMKSEVGEKTGFLNTMPSVKAGTTSFKQLVEGWGEDDASVTWTILRKTNEVNYTSITKGTISGISGWGVIDVQAKKGEEIYTYCLTVQRPLSASGSYTEQSTGYSNTYHYYTWDFHSNKLHKYVDNVTGNMNADSYIAGDLVNAAEEVGDWKWFQRKESGTTNNKTEYAHFYKPALQGDNGFVIPETIGLQIESAAFTRTTTGGGRRGFGIINVQEKRVPSDALSATPGDYIDFTKDDAHACLTVQEGVTITIPKLKAGWYVEMQWARLDPANGVNIQTSNLLDLNGNLVNTTLQIGRCQDKLSKGGYYTFQVAGDPSDDDDYRDVSFTVLPEGYDNLYQIRVYDGMYQEMMSDMKVGQNTTNIADMDINDAASPMQNYILLYDDTKGVDPVNFTYANNLGSPVAPSRVCVTTEGPLEAEMVYSVSHAALVEGSSDREHGYYAFPVVQLQNGYGRFIITYTLYSEDRKYVIASKKYRFNVGLQPHQNYPFTWNFENISGGAVRGKNNNAYNSIRTDYLTWTNLGYETFELDTETNGGSLYVPGATLVTIDRNLGAKGTISELNEAGKGCDELNGLGFNGQVVFKLAQQGAEADDAPTGDWSRGTENSLLSYNLSDESTYTAYLAQSTTVDDKTNWTPVELTAGDGKVMFGSPGKRETTTVGGRSYAYKMDGGNSKNVKLIPQRPFQNGDVIHLTGYSSSNVLKSGFSFYGAANDVAGDALVTINWTNSEANTEATLDYTVTRGDGIAGRKEVYLFRADKQYTVYLSEVSITGDDASAPTAYERALTCEGEVTVTIPDLRVDDYVYIKSSAAPTAESLTASNLTAAEAADGLDAIPYDAEKSVGVYKYKVNAAGNADVTFASDTKIYRIGVTNIMKPLTRVGTGDAWATESRDHAIDYRQTGYLTVNDIKAHTVAATNYTLQKVTVRLNELTDAVPAETGLVLKLKLVGAEVGETSANVNNFGKAKGGNSVPLFYPPYSATILDSTTVGFGGTQGNMMMANLYERVLTEERETGVIDKDGDTVDDSGADDGEYTRFLLAQRYMKWTKVTSDGVSTISHSGFADSGDVPVFYRMHKYATEQDDKTAEQLNTLGANKAYMLIRSGNVPDALWKGESPAVSRRYIGIEGISDMDEFIEDNQYGADSDAREGTYDLRGRKVADNGNLRPGVYIRDGRKIVIK